MPKHARIGGSSIGRTLRCPGSVKLIESLPQRPPSSAAADRGTMLHAMLAKMIETGCTPESLVGSSYEGVRLESGDARRMLLPAAFALRQFLAGATHLQLEVRVRLDAICWGTADALAYRPYAGYLADFKFGSGEVDVENNEQLLFYSAAALECGKLPDSIKVVHAAIIQPALRPVLRQTVFPLARVQEFAATVRATAKIALKDGAPLVPGETQCRWCPAKASCPALQHGGGDTLANTLTHLQHRI